MKKILIPFAVCMGLAAFGVSADTTVELTLDSPGANVMTDTVNVLELNVSPFIENGNTYVPLSAICDSFGISKYYDSETGLITITKDDKIIEFVVGSTEAGANGSLLALDSPITIQNDEFIVPLRATAENLGYSVEYVASLNTILISDKLNVMTINGYPVSFDEFALYYNINKAAIPTKDVTDEQITEYKAQLKDQLINMLKQNYTLYNNAINGGFGALFQDPSATLQIKEQSDSVYTNYKDITTLKSVIASTMEKSQIASNFSKIIESAVKPADEEINKIYNTDYISAKHILIPIINTETGEALTEDDQKAALKTATEALNKVKKGGDFDALMKEYSKDTGLANYPDGYSFTKGQMTPEFETASYNLKENEVSELVKTSYGYHIIKRTALLPITEDLKSFIQQNLQKEKFSEYLQGVIDKSDIQINEDLINTLN